MTKPPVRLSSNSGPYASGAIAAIAAAGTATVVFDLGEDWQKFTSIQISLAAAGLTGNVAAYAGDTPTPTTTRPVADLLSGAAMAGLPLSSGNLVALVPPMGRYLYLVVANSGGSPYAGPGVATFAAYA